MLFAVSISVYWHLCAASRHRLDLHDLYHGPRDTSLLSLAHLDHAVGRRYGKSLAKPASFTGLFAFRIGW